MDKPPYRSLEPVSTPQQQSYLAKLSVRYRIALPPFSRLSKRRASELTGKIQKDHKL